MDVVDPIEVNQAISGAHALTEVEEVEVAGLPTQTVNTSNTYQILSQGREGEEERENLPIMPHNLSHQSAFEDEAP